MNNYAYLIFVDAGSNHNKFYEIKENDDSSIDVSYGRVGAAATNHHYESYEKTFYGLYRSKTGKGYIDMTQDRKETVVVSKTEDSYKKIEDSQVQKFVDLLLERQKQAIETNYTNPTNVTQDMIDKGRDYIETLKDFAKSDFVSCYTFNCTLIDLFSLIPRKMGNVNDFLLTQDTSANAIIQREEQLLDNLESRILQQNPIKAQSGNKSEDILQANGISMRQITYKEEDLILEKLGDKNGVYKTAFAIENVATQKNFDDFVKNHHFKDKDVTTLWHGSPNKNWWKIATQGMDIKKARDGMFGYGLYFAPKAEKSMGYMSTGSYWRGGNDETGYLALFDVATGKPYNPTHTLYGFRESDLKHQADCVWAYPKDTGLRNEEVVIYNNAQCTIKYIVEVYAKERTKYQTLDTDKISLGNHIPSLEKKDGQIQFEIVDVPAALWEKCGHADKIIGQIDKTGSFLTLSCEDGNRVFTPNLTNWDNAFLLRECKKTFFESDKEWFAFIEDIKDKKDVVLENPEYTPLKEDEEEEYDR